MRLARVGTVFGGALGVAAACGRGQDSPEDQVPILQSEADEVLAVAGLSHLLPRKHRVSRVPSLESRGPLRRGPSPSSLPSAPASAQESRDSGPVPTHHALPEQEAAGRAGPNLQLHSLGCFRQAVVEERGRGQKPETPVLPLGLQAVPTNTFLPPGEDAAGQGEEAVVVEVGSVLPGGICEVGWEWGHTCSHQVPGGSLTPPPHCRGLGPCGP